MWDVERACESIADNFGSMMVQPGFNISKKFENNVLGRASFLRVGLGRDGRFRLSDSEEESCGNVP